MKDGVILYFLNGPWKGREIYMMHRPYEVLAPYSPGLGVFGTWRYQPVGSLVNYYGAQYIMEGVLHTLVIDELETWQKESND